MLIKLINTKVKGKVGPLLN